MFSNKADFAKPTCSNSKWPTYVAENLNADNQADVYQKGMSLFF